MYFIDNVTCVFLSKPSLQAFEGFLFIHLYTKSQSQSSFYPGYFSIHKDNCNETQAQGSLVYQALLPSIATSLAAPLGTAVMHRDKIQAFQKKCITGDENKHIYLSTKLLLGVWPKPADFQTDAGTPQGLVLCLNISFP